jgi:hypothetical protein
MTRMPLKTRSSQPKVRGLGTALGKGQNATAKAIAEVARGRGGR